MGFSVAEGSFVYIFVLLIPLGILILNFLNFKLKALISLVLSLFGFFMAVVINNEIGQYGDSLVIFLFFIGYIVLIAFNVITLIDDNKDKVGNMGSSIADSVKNAINSETVQQGLTNAKQAASNISGKVKNTVSDISNHDVKKASSIADQLKTYKDLLDQGIITQEEFEKKKSEIL
jgi:hypothetical protein